MLVEEEAVGDVALSSEQRRKDEARKGGEGGCCQREGTRRRRRRRGKARSIILRRVREEAGTTDKQADGIGIIIILPLGKVALVLFGRYGGRGSTTSNNGGLAGEGWRDPRPRTLAPSGPATFCFERLLPPTAAAQQQTRPTKVGGLAGTRVSTQ